VKGAKHDLPNCLSTHLVEAAAASAMVFSWWQKAQMPFQPAPPGRSRPKWQTRARVLHRCSMGG